MFNFIFHLNSDRAKEIHDEGKKHREDLLKKPRKPSFKVRQPASLPSNKKRW